MIRSSVMHVESQASQRTRTMSQPTLESSVVGCSTLVTWAQKTLVSKLGLVQRTLVPPLEGTL